MRDVRRGFGPFEIAGRQGGQSGRSFRIHRSMNLALLVAGGLGLVAAAVHGVAGELLVVRKLDAGSVLDGDTASAVAVVAAAAFTGFAMVAVGLGAAKQPLRAALKHPGPAVLAATAALAWLGAL